MRVHIDMNLVSDIMLYEQCKVFPPAHAGGRNERGSACALVGFLAFVLLMMGDESLVCPVDSCPTGETFSEREVAAHLRERHSDLLQSTHALTFMKSFGKSKPNRNCVTHTEERWKKKGCKKCGLYDAGGPPSGTALWSKEKRWYLCPNLTALIASHPVKRKARGCSSLRKDPPYVRSEVSYVSYLTATPRKEDLDPKVSYFYSQHTALSNIYMPISGS